MPRRHKKMKGGFLDSLSSTLSSWGSTISQSASDAYNKTKSAASSAYSSATGSTPTYTAPATTTSYAAPNTSYTPSTTSTYGGKRRKSKKMRGGVSSNIALTGLAANASPISGIKTAQPHNWVGGKRTRKNKRESRKKY